MGVWDAYEARVTVNGDTKRDRLLQHTQDNISRKIEGSLSCHDVLINGIEQTVTITDERGNSATKNIHALPGESLTHGGLVDFAKSKWLITDIDANDEVYCSGKIKRCNYLLRWLNDAGTLIEKWCIVEDGSSSLIGEKNTDLMAIGDARLAITIAKDEDTRAIRRGKRFLIDDKDAMDVLAYQITKSDRLYNLYDGVGIYRFILTEVNVTDNDSKELLIADYYSYNGSRSTSGNAKGVWI